MGMGKIKVFYARNAARKKARGSRAFMRCGNFLPGELPLAPPYELPYEPPYEPPVRRRWLLGFLLFWLFSVLV